MTETLERPAAGEAASADPLRRLLDELREDFQLGTGDYLRAERVRLLLAGRGVKPDDPQAAYWLAPVLCNSALEQELFHRRFGELFAAPTPNATLPPAAQLQADHAVKRSRRWRWVWVAAVLVAALAVWIAVKFGSAPWRGAPPPTTPVAAAAEQLGVAPRFSRLFERPLIFAPLLASLGLIWWRRRQRMTLSRAFAPAGGHTQSVAFTAEAPPLYGDPRLARALAAFRWHRAAPGGRLNVGRTIRATLRKGGLPELRFGTRPQTPEYLLLVDFESPRDHLPLAGDLLMRHFEDERVVVSRYDFFGDPRWLARSASDRAGHAHVRLSDLIAQNADARVLLLTEAQTFFDPRGTPHRWAIDLANGSHLVVLTPRRSSDWGWAERELDSMGVLVLPATSDGVMGYAERLKAGVQERLPRWVVKGHRQIDLPTRLAPHRWALLDDESPSDSEIRELVIDLQAWLDPDAFQMLQALAVFPRLDPQLTLHLGAVLRNGAGDGPLLIEEALLSIARLPWLRAGRMPDWLRRALIAPLPPARLDAILAALQAYLQPVQPGAGRATLEIARRGLMDWLSRDPSHELDDRIFIDALAGRHPRELAVEAPPSLREWARRTIGSGDWIPLLAGAILSLAILIASDQVYRLLDEAVTTLLGLRGVKLATALYARVWGPILALSAAPAGLLALLLWQNGPRTWRRAAKWLTVAASGAAWLGSIWLTMAEGSQVVLGWSFLLLAAALSGLTAACWEDREPRPQHIAALLRLEPTTGRAAATLAGLVLWLLGPSLFASDRGLSAGLPEVGEVLAFAMSYAGVRLKIGWRNAGAARTAFGFACGQALPCVVTVAGMRLLATSGISAETAQIATIYVAGMRPAFGLVGAALAARAEFGFSWRRESETGGLRLWGPQLLAAMFSNIWLIGVALMLTRPARQVTWGRLGWLFAGYGLAMVWTAIAVVIGSVAGSPEVAAREVGSLLLVIPVFLIPRALGYRDLPGEDALAQAERVQAAGQNRWGRIAAISLVGVASALLAGTLAMMLERIAPAPAAKPAVDPFDAAVDATDAAAAANTDSAASANTTASANTAATTTPATDAPPPPRRKPPPSRPPPSKPPPSKPPQSKSPPSKSPTPRAPPISTVEPPPIVVMPAPQYRSPPLNAAPDEPAGEANPAQQDSKMPPVEQTIAPNANAPPQRAKSAK